MTDPFKDRSETDYESLLRRHIALRHQVDHLSILREIGLAVNASLELSETLPVIANVVQGALDVRRLTIYELKNDGEALVPIVAKYGGDLIGQARLAEESVHVPGTAFGEAIRTRSVTLTDTPYSHRAHVPLIAKDDVFGIMLLEDRQDATAFTQDDIELFRQLGLQIAVAIDNARLYAMAVTDGLTGLYVRRYFDLRMVEQHEQARRYDRTFSLLMFDIDHFKKFNDTYGHQTGDRVLRQFARLLEDNTRKADICCRYGGEEMTVILPETRLDKACLLATKLCTKIRNQAFTGLEGNALHVTTSIGVVEYDAAFAAPDAMVKAVDEALYASKESGRNRVEVAERWHDGSRTR